MTRLLMLDTNILLALVRANAVGSHVEGTFQLSKQAIRPHVSIVSHGEIWVIAERNGWGSRKREALDIILRNVATVPIDDESIVQAYVDIERANRAAKGGAQTMGKNDIWIAATAKLLGAELITTDKDFDHLHGDCITRHWVDPSQPG